MTAHAPAEMYALVELLPDEWAWTLNEETGKLRGNCIAASLLTTTVMRRLGIACKPMAVDIDVTNRVAEVCLVELGMKELPVGAWSVGCRCDIPAEGGDYRFRNEPGRKTGFGGHLITVGDGWFADLTVEQFHRPDQGIVIPGAIIGPDLRSDGDKGILYRLECGGAIRWFMRPEVKHWRTTPAWRQGVNPKLVTVLCRQIRERVAA